VKILNEPIPDYYCEKFICRKNAFDTFDVKILLINDSIYWASSINSADYSPIHPPKKTMPYPNEPSCIM
jgi:hypothetical protein